MRRAREKGKVAFETYKEPDTQESKDLKKALSSKLPTEIDYYLEDADHEEGTNKYTFKFPQEWRTLAKADLVFGVRGMFVNNDIKWISGELIIYIPRGKEVDEIKIDITDYYPVYHRFNKVMSRIINGLHDKINEYNKSHGTYFFLGFIYNFHKNPADGFMSLELNNKIEPNIKFRVVGERCFTHLFNLHKYDSETKYDSIIFSGIERYEKYLVQASFVNTKHQHLGFTGVQYQPVKYYKIENNVNEFHLGLFSEDGSKMLEFPKNKIDHFVIETLILQDSNYMLTI